MSLQILFISKGSNNEISPIIRSQLKSLVVLNYDVDHFLIKGNGIGSYFRSIPLLSKQLKYTKYNIIHVHFSYSAIPYLFLRSKPWVVSFMGSDLKRSRLNLLFSKFISYLASDSIVKSNEMKNILRRPCHVIPNGVDIAMFKPINTDKAKEILEWDNRKKQVLFAANSSRPEKNFPLAQKAIELLANRSVEMKTLENVPHSKIPVYMNAADVVLLSSKYEGSPNVIKEALACDKPVVCTNVGDVKENYENIKGVYVSDHNPIDLKDCLERALARKISNGREYIIRELSDIMIAKKLGDLYAKVLNGNN